MIVEAAATIEGEEEKAEKEKNNEMNIGRQSQNYYTEHRGLRPVSVSL